MFDKIRQVIKTAMTTDAPATPAPAAIAIVTLPATHLATTDTLDAAVAQVVSGRADLITIKVNGIAEAKANAVWLTKGQDRTQPATAVRLVDCTSDHLKNIVANKPDLSADYLRVIESILEDRGEALPDPADDSFIS